MLGVQQEEHFVTGSHLTPCIPTKSSQTAELGGALLRCALERLQKERKKNPTDDCILRGMGVGWVGKQEYFCLSLIFLSLREDTL